MNPPHGGILMLRHWQLLFAGCWAALTGFALLRNWLVDPEVLGRLPIKNWTMAAIIGSLMGIWNLARWWHQQSLHRQRAARLPLQPNPYASREYEYNPELDFQKPPRPE
jgi:hypothetical protein